MLDPQSSKYMQNYHDIRNDSIFFILIIFLNIFPISRAWGAFHQSSHGNGMVNVSLLSIGLLTVTLPLDNLLPKGTKNVLTVPSNLVSELFSHSPPEI